MSDSSSMLGEKEPCGKRKTTISFQIYSVRITVKINSCKCLENREGSSLFPPVVSIYQAQVPMVLSHLSFLLNSTVWIKLCPSPKLLCCGPKPQYLRMGCYLEIESFPI